MQSGAWLINTARGPVVDNRALKHAIVDGHLGAVALDVWEDEPTPDPALIQQVDFATPHIAGHSREGRLRGTAMVAAAAADFFGVDSNWQWCDALPAAPEAATESDPVAAVLAAYDPRADDARLRNLLKIPLCERPRAFDRIRGACPPRREFGFHRVDGDAPAVVQATGLGVPDAADAGAKQRS